MKNSFEVEVNAIHLVLILVVIFVILAVQYIVRGW